MRYIFFFFLFSSFNLFSQQISFRGKLIDTIVIKSHVAVYQFDGNGTTIGNEEEIAIYYSETDSSYYYGNHQKIKFEVAFRNNIDKVETRKIKGYTGIKLDRGLVEKLVVSFGIDEHPSASFEEKDTGLVYDFINYKRVLKVAKWYDEAWQFRFKKKKERNELLADMREFDSIISFFKEEFNGGFTFVSDYSNSIFISIVTSQKTHTFEGDFYNLARQPWIYSDSIFHQVFNLKVNEVIVELLPKGFMLMNSLTYESITEFYIIWYLKRRGYIYE